MVLYQLRSKVKQLRNIWLYFITDEDSTKERDLNINIINNIHSIKGKTSVNVLVSNYKQNTLSSTKENT